MTPTLSIITINYNNKDGLIKTIESVVNQKETNFEYIIIDGASTDGSAELIKEYAEHTEYGKKITQWVSEPDDGIYNAMNKGIGKANGEYVHLLNSGDWYEENALNHILPKLKEEKPDVLLCAVNILDANKLLKTEVRYKDNLHASAMLHQGMIYKRMLHKRFGSYSEAYKYASDYDFCLKLYSNDETMHSYIYEPTVNFVTGGVGYSAESYLEAQQIQKNYSFINTKQNSTKKHFSSKEILKLFLPPVFIILLKKFVRGYKN